MKVSKIPTSRRKASRFAMPSSAGVAAFLVCVAAFGCGGGGGGGGTSPTPTPAATPTPTPTPFAAPSVNLTANKVNLLRGENVNLTWNSSEASTVASSNFGANVLNGSLLVTPTETTTYTLTVTGPGGQKTASFTINVAAVSVTVTPPAGAVPINKSLPLAAAVSGAVDSSVSWSVQEAGGGTIRPDAVNPVNAAYIAPSQAGVFHVVATSNADSSKTAVVEVKAQVSDGSVTIH